jgi:hypothetical protein
VIHCTEDAICNFLDMHVFIMMSKIVKLTLLLKKKTNSKEPDILEFKDNSNEKEKSSL